MIALAKLQPSVLCEHTVKVKRAEFSILCNLFFLGEWQGAESPSQGFKTTTKNLIFIICFFLEEDSHQGSSTFIQTSLASEGGNNTVCFLFVFFSIRSQRKFQDMLTLRQSY